MGLLGILARHWRLANVSFSLAEEKVLISVASDLQIYDMTHVFEIFKLVMELFLTVFIIISFILPLFAIVLHLVLHALLLLARGRA